MVLCSPQKEWPRALATPTPRTRGAIPNWRNAPTLPPPDTPALHVAGFEDEDENEGPNESLIMSGFFIQRPILAIVLSILTVIVGLVCLLILPVSLYPNITPPEIVVSASFPGSDAVTVEQSLATPIEQQISGVDKLNYMYSLNSNTGQMKLRANFDENSDPKTDQVLTQMRQSQAGAQLPPEAVSQGVSVQKSFAAPLMLIALRSPDGGYDSSFLTNYAYINLNDQLTRVPGISNVQVFGSGQYAIRIWLKPEQLGRYNVTVSDVTNAVQQQNAVHPVGFAGGEPVPSGQEFTYMAVARGLLTTPDQFGEHHRPSRGERRCYPDQRCGQGRAWFASLQYACSLEWPAQRNSRGLSTPGQQCISGCRRSQETNDGAPAAVSARHGLCDFAGYHLAGNRRC